MVVTAHEIRTPQTTRMVERLMGNKPEERFKFIQENAEFAEEVVDI